MKLFKNFHIHLLFFILGFAIGIVASKPESDVQDKEVPEVPHIHTLAYPAYPLKSYHLAAP